MMDVQAHKTNIIANTATMAYRNLLKTLHNPVSYTHLRAHETDSYLVCRLLLEKKKKNQKIKTTQKKKNKKMKRTEEK